MGKIVVTPENCTGCNACMLACSFAHEKASSYRLSRIKIRKIEDIENSVPVVCQHCEDAPCMDACPVGAIRRGAENEVLLSSEDCTGCQQCLEVCPFRAIFFNQQKGVAFKCDLCQGAPACVKMCQLAKAIRYER